VDSAKGADGDIALDAHVHGGAHPALYSKRFIHITQEID
jgi:hypothetical protein